jgi:hypothetical protein
LAEYLRVAPSLRGVWSALLLVVFTAVGWRLSIGLGYDYGRSHSYVAAGAVDIFLVPLDALFAWVISQRRVLFVMLITGGGNIGGLVFQLLNAVSKISGDIWVLALYLE